MPSACLFVCSLACGGAARVLDDLLARSLTKCPQRGAFHRLDHHYAKLAGSSSQMGGPGQKRAMKESRDMRKNLPLHADAAIFCRQGVPRLALSSSAVSALSFLSTDFRRP
jgi:hypothetical protein